MSVEDTTEQIRYTSSIPTTHSGAARSPRGTRTQVEIQFRTPRSGTVQMNNLSRARRPERPIGDFLRFVFSLAPSPVESFLAPPLPPLAGVPPLLDRGPGLGFVGWSSLQVRGPSPAASRDARQGLAQRRGPDVPSPSRMILRFRTSKLPFVTHPPLSSRTPLPPLGGSFPKPPRRPPPSTSPRRLPAHHRRGPRRLTLPLPGFLRGKLCGY